LRPGQSFEPLKIPHRSQPARRAQFADHFVPATLVMRRRAKPSRRRGLQFDALEKSVKRQIEIEPRLLAVGDHVEAGLELVVNRNGDGVLDQFLAIGFAELVQILAGELQPAGKRITADDGRSEGRRGHEVGGMRYEV